MTPEKVLEVIGVSRNFFESNGVNKIKLSEEEFDEYLLIADTQDSIKIFAHCHAMLDEMQQFVNEGRMEKCFRWLGFIQGCLWCDGRFTLNELKNHNRPNDQNE